MCTHLFNEIGHNALDLIAVDVLLSEKYHGSLKCSKRKLVGAEQQVSKATGVGEGYSLN
jgi:hypothetical protein